MGLSTATKTRTTDGVAMQQVRFEFRALGRCRTSDWRCCLKQFFIHFLSWHQRLQVSGLLKEAVIRDVVWEGKKGRIFFGDSFGRVAVTSLPKVYTHYCSGIGSHSLSCIQAMKKSSLLRRTNEVIFQDKSPVVQLVSISPPTSLSIISIVPVGSPW